MVEKSKEAAGDDKKSDELEIEVIEEGQGSQETQTGERQQADQERAGQYEYADDEEGQEQGDQRLAQQPGQQGQQQDQQQSQQTAEQTARQRRRQRERDARRREQAELQRLRQENAALVQRQQEIDARISNVELSGIDGQIASLESEIQRANSVMRRALESQQSDDFVKAQDIRDVLRDRLRDLKEQKKAAAQEMEQGGGAQGGRVQGQRQQLPPGVYPEQVHYARIFVGRHPWYDTNARDPDSRQVQSIDNEMVAEGFNPRTPEYWMELERRVQEELPHKFQTGFQDNGSGGGNTRQNGGGNNGKGNSNKAGGPKLPGGGAGGGANSPVKFHLSAARKQALIDLGVYDDPKQRMAHIRRFIEWDKANPSTTKQ